MKRQIIACLWVVLALLLLFKGQVVLGCGARIYVELLPGGLQVTYYRGMEFGEIANVRTERRVVRDYDKKCPIWNASRNGYSARWEGFLHVPEDAEYGFFLQSNDGSRVFINDELIIDHWGDHGWIPGKHVKVWLGKGRQRIRIEHYNRDGAGAIRLKWAGGPVPANTVLAVPYITKE